MKKIIATICAIAMLLSFATTAFASDWDVLTQQYTSYDATVEFSVVLNKPLECLALLNEELGFDIKYMIEELTKAKYTAKIQAEMSDDALSAKLAMKINSNVPLNISEDLKFGADVTFYVWMDYDFTDVENAKYHMIIKNPLDGSYITIDYFDFMEQSTGVDMASSMVETYSQLNTKAGMEEIMALVKSVYEKNATLTKEGNEYTVTMTNDGIIDMAFEMIMGYFDTEYAKSLGIDTSEMFGEEVQMKEVQETVKDLGVFGENDALVMKVKTNDAGQMIETQEAVHFDFNIVDLAVALGAGEDEMYPLTRDVADIDLTLKSKSAYEKINEKNIVQFPELTEENSIDIMELLDYSLVEDDYYYDEDYFVELETYQPEMFWDYAKGAMDRGGMYVDINEFLDSCYWDADNLTGETVLGEDGSVVITLTSDTFGTVSVKGNIKDDEYMLNATKLWARKPFKVVEEYSWDEYTGEKKLYVNMDVLHYILGAKIQSITTYILDDYGVEMTSPEYYFDIVRPNMAYVGE